MKNAERGHLPILHFAFRILHFAFSEMRSSQKPFVSPVPLVGV
jgi:hypothetical protein